LGVLFGCACVLAQCDLSDWQGQVRERVKNHELHDALQIVEQRLAQDPADLEACGWRARLLAWNGRWAEAEQEYRKTLKQAPNDTDLLTGLSDVLFWQQQEEQALSLLDRAIAIAPKDPDLLLRRARLLRQMGHAERAREDYLGLLRLDPHNREARNGIASLRGTPRHELRIGDDVDTFSYTDTAQAQTFLLSSRWTDRWLTIFGINLYQRFGQDAIKFQASTVYHFTKADWLSAGGSTAHDQGVIPKQEALFEYGHAFRFRWVALRGLEASYQQHWLWYQGAHVLALSLNQIYYFPGDWTWALNVTGSRSGLSGVLVDWVPSGSTRLGFPLFRRLSGNVSFGVGSENFAQVDQIGRFAARTYGGGLRYRLTDNQDVRGYFSRQDRTQGRTQQSAGISYGIRF
jgi:tetratricopeptide (TPR) repeat protein